MGVAYYISFEKPLPGVDATSVSGKAVANAQPDLKRISEKLGVRDLMDFFSARPAAAEDLLDGAGDVMAKALDELKALKERLGKPTGPGSPDAASIKAGLDAVATRARSARPAPESWFPAAEGLKTIRALLQHLNESAPSFNDSNVKRERVVTDLQQMENVLMAADRAGVRFHLSIDI